MHGALKVYSTAEQLELKRKEREKKLNVYRVEIGKVFKKRTNGEYDQELLDITGFLLSSNPDIYTLWNYRRETLVHMKENCPTDEFQKFMDGELRLTQLCLQVNPKSYGGWHHRVWVLDHMPTPNWNNELALCTKYLNLDERNFHVWDHRRLVVARAKVPAVEELEYSTSKISTNFSNYSSWHYRSRLLPRIFPDPQGKRPIREDQHKKELELVQNAAFTDPNDQSAWFYLRWLLGRPEERLAFAGALVTRAHACIALTQSINIGCESWNVQLNINGQKVSGTWKSSKPQQSHVWMFYPDVEFDPISSLTSVVVSLQQDSQEIDSMTLKVTDGEAFGRCPSQFGLGFTKELTSLMEEELDSCIQLLDMEPDSKWTLLTSVLLMQAIDRHKYREDTMLKLDQLLQADVLRTGYYNDLRSRLVVEYAINAMEESSKSTLLREINLSRRNLTAFYHGHHLSLLSRVDLGNNKLFRSLSQLHVLQCCTWLSLDDNLIENLNDMPSLPALETLSLRQNKIASFNNIRYLRNCKSLCSINLENNPVETDSNLKHIITEVLPSITMLNGEALAQ